MGRTSSSRRHRWARACGAAFIPGALAWGIDHLMARAEERSGPSTGLGKIMGRSHGDGSAVSLREGPAIALALVAGAPFVARRALSRTSALAASGPSRAYLSYSVAVAGSAVAGILDDHGETLAPGQAPDKGLRGHLRAAKQGRITTGFAKIIIIGAAGGISALLLSPGEIKGSGALARLLRLGVRSVGIAGWANVINLLDLRPGRAIKASAIVLVPAIGRGSGAVISACAGVLGEDLGGRTMLGDTGANALGAAIGWIGATSSAPVRIICAASAVGLTIASEKISFSRVINDVPALRAFDMWGRPAH